MQHCKKENSYIYFFSEQEIPLMVAEATKLYQNNTPVHRMGDPVVMLLNTGMSIGEALALQWKYIDFLNNQITIRNTVKCVKNREEGANAKYTTITQMPTKTSAG